MRAMSDAMTNHGGLALAARAFLAVAIRASLIALPFFFAASSPADAGAMRFLLASAMAAASAARAYMEN